MTRLRRSPYVVRSKPSMPDWILFALVLTAAILGVAVGLYVRSHFQLPSQ